MKKYTVALILVIMLIVALTCCWLIVRVPEWPNTTAGAGTKVGARTIYQGKTYELKYWDPGDRGAGATPAECSWWAEVQ